MKKFFGDFGNLINGIFFFLVGAGIIVAEALSHEITVEVCVLGGLVLVAGIVSFLTFIFEKDPKNG